MTTDEIRRKLEIALERKEAIVEAQREREDRAANNQEDAYRKRQAAERDMRYYKDRLTVLRSLEVSVDDLP